MVSVKRIEAGNYSVSDGRSILKDGSGWYVLAEDGGHDFGPVTTLTAAKEYVETGIVPLSQHNFGSAYGRRQSKKEFNAYLASEAEQGNYGPAILYTLAVVVVVILFAFIKNNQ
ncbi:DUF2487 family protein [Teredinibacter purpureus]|uniref:DUF2487 family protein n=1 Tax=Teredinibacter purpureus TaxID=2731756 RepID=UPI0005F80C3D|nr:DUF2487 family protein [Teredinibacter purpureus]